MIGAAHGSRRSNDWKFEAFLVLLIAGAIAGAAAFVRRVPALSSSGVIVLVLLLAFALGVIVGRAIAARFIARAIGRELRGRRYRAGWFSRRGATLESRNDDGSEPPDDEVDLVRWGAIAHAVRRRGGGEL